MVEPVAAAGTSPRKAQVPWDQQPGENELWYARFLRFVALGPGRSVSLVATGRRNAYPIPAHWPIQAKQRLWRERATAFDAAAKKNPRAIQELNNTLALFAGTSPNGEGEALTKVVKAGGYKAPLPEDEDSDLDEGTPKSASSSR